MTPASGLLVHRSERADALVEALGDVLTGRLPDPLAAEVISVPTRGVERWLTQRLSGRLGTSPGRGDGVCANVDFPFPGRLVGGAVAAASGIERDADPWLPERAVWPLLDVLDECLAEPWLSTVAGHLGAGGRTGGSRRFATARHITDLYDRYAVHRPAMLRSWAAGADVDEGGSPLPEDAAWQAELWRRLRRRIGAPGPAERLEDAWALLEADPALAALPDRVSLFGLTRLPASYLHVLRSLAVHRDVHLFLLHPSPVLWERAAGRAPAAPSALRRGDDPTADLPRNPLLASWGRDAREMQVVLGGSAGEHRPVGASPTDTLLHRIQGAVRDDMAPPGEPLPGEDDRRALLDPSDRSVQVHACHGRARQVEVLRDAILHLLADDPTLEARDVIVMCPDIEAFAPLIHATFGAGAGAGSDDEDGAAAEAGGPIDLRVRLADRSLRQTNPLLGAVWNLLVLADARVTASQVLDFAGRDPVRRRFRLDDDDLSRLNEWVAATGIRWGLDAAHRAPFQLQAVGENTWRAGLDRVLIGAAMAEEDQRLVGGVLPLDDVDSGSIDLAGRLAELVDRLQVALGALAGPQPVTGWVEATAGAADALTAFRDDDAWQRAQLRRLLDEVVDEATAGGSPSAAELELGEFRSLLADRLRGQPTRANFRTGHLTVCTLVPMRSVPHRVVCLLGLDDGAFPRRTARDGDDLVLADPHVGDRDGRSEDLQLLLDAILAATERLVVTYTGRDERTNAERPPAVPVGELLDVVDATARAEAATGPTRDSIVVHHPLQPFDRRNFVVGDLVANRRWSFDTVSLEGARALAGGRTPAGPFLAGPSPPAPSEVVELDALVRFVQHPVRAFLRQRLGIYLGDRSDDVDDALPVELDGLEAWGVGQRVLDACVAGAALDACIASERARGLLPPGALSESMLEQVRSTVVDLTAVAPPAGEPDSIEVNVRLDDGRLLVGTVPGVVDGGVRTVTYSRLKARDRVAAWARFLSLEGALDVVTVGRRRGDGPRGAAVTVARLAASRIDGEVARRRLHELLALYERGMCEPLPLYCATSAAYAQAVARGRDGAVAARKAWVSDRFPNEDADAEHVLVLGGVRRFEDLLAAGAFADHAHRLWDGLLAVESLEDR